MHENGWYEWKKSPDDPKKKQPYFIHSDEPIFFATISRFHTKESEQHDDGFVIVTAASDSGLLDIYDRRPAVLPPAAAREWLNPDTTSVRAEELATRGAMHADNFAWYPVSKEVGSTHNNSIKLIKRLNKKSFNFSIMLLENEVYLN
ncbi:TPA: SOS response-associated peptidase family protein [Serratia marcescens]